MTYKNLSTALFHGQLPMFMTAGEIKKHYRPYEGDYLDPEDTSHGGEETESELWDRKLRQSSLDKPQFLVEGKTLRAHIKEHGVQEPVELDVRSADYPESRSQVLSGHHRIASAAADRPNDLIPVRFRS